MRILIHGLNFAPELIGVGKYTGEMAHWLAARGHEVRAVTAPPFNPEWKVASGYSAWRYRRERYLYRSVGAQTRTLSAAAAMGGGAASSRSISFAFETGCPDPRDINTDNNQSDNNQSPPTNPACAGSLTVLRCPLWVPPHPSAIKRVLHLASFALTGFPAMLGQVSWRPDVVIAIEPTLLCAPAALIAAKLGRAKAWLHVQDFEADAGFQLGLLQSPALRSAVGWLRKKIHVRLRPRLDHLRKDAGAIGEQASPALGTLFVSQLGGHQKNIPFKKAEPPARRAGDRRRRNRGIVFWNHGPQAGS